jgi:hypothetical protein
MRMTRLILPCVVMFATFVGSAHAANYIEIIGSHYNNQPAATNNYVGEVHVHLDDATTSSVGISIDLDILGTNSFGLTSQGPNDWSAKFGFPTLADLSDSSSGTWHVNVGGVHASSSSFYVDFSFVTPGDFPGQASSLSPFQGQNFATSASVPGTFSWTAPGDAANADLLNVDSDYSNAFLSTLATDWTHGSTFADGFHEFTVGYYAIPFVHEANVIGVSGINVDTGDITWGTSPLNDLLNGALLDGVPVVALGGVNTVSFTVGNAIPEPTTLAMLGLAALGLARRRA